ncbi:MAG: hypothetical protein R3E50_12510 [Halioglobus sp.]
MNTIKILAVSGLYALLAMAIAVPASAASARPNILLLISDDQRWDQLGVVQQEQGKRARFPFLETPRWMRSPHRACVFATPS